ncbi:MAG TPA: glycosyltransferase family 4 protein [Bacteroidota bacterium]|nr:glycosyltransferase family 4 protein [Bacteroidota bacterium]
MIGSTSEERSYLAEPLLEKGCGLRTGDRERIRCLFVSVPFGGIEVHFRSLQSALTRAADIDATWEYIGWTPDEGSIRLPLLSNNWTLRASRACQARIRRSEAGAGTFDVAVFNSIVPMFGLGNFLRRTPALLSLDATPAVLDSFGSWYGQKQGAMGRLLGWYGDRIHARRRYHAAPRIIAWSPLIKQSLVNDYKVRHETVTVMAPGIDLRRWTPGPGDASPGLQPQAGRLRILFVGREFLRKGGDLLVELARLDDFAGCDFHLVTQCPVSNELPTNVHVHAGVAPDADQLLDMYRSADIFVLPTRADLYPTLACCEAMATGLPIITTNVGGLEYLFDDGNGGFAIPANDPVALCDRLRALVASPALRRQFGARNRRYAEQYFDLDQQAHRVKEELFAAVRSHRARSAPSKRP